MFFLGLKESAEEMVKIKLEGKAAELYIFNCTYELLKVKWKRYNFANMGWLWAQS